MQRPFRCPAGLRPQRAGGSGSPGSYRCSARRFSADLVSGWRCAGRSRAGVSPWPPGSVWPGSGCSTWCCVVRARYDIPALNAPPEELTPVMAGEHGTVHRGRSDVPLEGGGSRPTFDLVVPARGNPCEQRGSYRWYQYVRLRLTLDGQLKRLRKPIEGATGLKYFFDKWNPDYHVSEVAATDPGFSPPGLDLDADRLGKPFRHYDVPGTRTAGGTSTLTGVLDAPNFCQRGERTHSPAEQLLERFFPAEGTVREDGCAAGADRAHRHRDRGSHLSRVASTAPRPASGA